MGLESVHIDAGRCWDSTWELWNRRIGWRKTPFQCELTFGLREITTILRTSMAWEKAPRGGTNGPATLGENRISLSHRFD